MGIFLALVLFTYHQEDPSWTHISDTNALIHNSGGPFGAWLSDILFSLFGFSAWWSVLLTFYAIWYGYLKLNTDHAPTRFFLRYNGLGFGLFLVASAALESGHIVDLPVILPQGAGGMVGSVIDKMLTDVVGFIGSTLVFIVLAMSSFSLFTGLSWITMIEKFGQLVIKLYEMVVFRWHDWQDKRVGRAVEQERSEFVDLQRQKVKDRAPVKIADAVTDFPKSERVQKEKQTTLFGTTDTGLPALHLLDPANNDVALPSKETLDFTSRLIERKLMDFGIEVKVLAALPGPVITRYELEPSPGVKGRQVMNLMKDLARALSVVSVRVVETIPGKTCMGLEIPNVNRQIVYLSEIMSSKAYADVNSPLTISLGKDISGKPVVADLAKMPHVLVAGTTGSGKSVAINALILSILYKADASKVRLILIDPKVVELSVYEGIPHLLAPVVTDMHQNHLHPLHLRGPH